MTTVFQLSSLTAFWLNWWPLLVAILPAVALIGWVVWRLKKVKSERNARAQRMRKQRKRKNAQPPKASPSVSIVHAVPLEAPESRPLILVVDDSKTALMHIQRVLDAQPYRVVVAEDGRQAWGLMQDESPALIISDIDMPFMTGLDLLKLVRSDLRLMETPFILMTSNLYLHLQASKAAGYDSLLSKPYRPEDLVEQVRHFLED